MLPRVIICVHFLWVQRTEGRHDGRIKQLTLLTLESILYLLCKLAL